MTETPTTNADSPRTPDAHEQAGGPATVSGQTSVSPSSLTQGDPPRRPFGERPADAVRKVEPIKRPFPLQSAQTDEDAGEYGQGLRAEAAAPVKGAPGKPSPKPTQAQPGTKHDKSSSDCNSPDTGSVKKPDGKSGGCCTP